VLLHPGSPGAATEPIEPVVSFSRRPTLRQKGAELGSSPLFPGSARLCLQLTGPGIRHTSDTSECSCKKLALSEGIWLVSFMHSDLRYFDLEQKTLQPLDNPLGTRLSPTS
jgi:hypothetical protein